MSLLSPPTLTCPLAITESPVASVIIILNENQWVKLNRGKFSLSTHFRFFYESIQGKKSVAGFLLGVCGLSDEANESDADERPFNQPAFHLFDQGESLLRLIADGGEQLSAIGELIDESRDDSRRGGGDDDPIEGGFFGPTGSTVGDSEKDIRQVELGKTGGGALGKLRQSLDGENAASEHGEDGSLVAGAGSDLQDPVVRLDAKGFGHVGDDVGLRNRLTEANRQGAVVVCIVGDVDRHKMLAREAAHDAENARVFDSAGPDLLIHHLQAPGAGKAIGGP